MDWKKLFIAYAIYVCEQEGTTFLETEIDVQHVLLEADQYQHKAEFDEAKKLIDEALDSIR